VTNKQQDVALFSTNATYTTLLLHLIIYCCY